MPAAEAIDEFDPAKPFQLVPTGGAVPAFDPGKPFQLRSPETLPPYTPPVAGPGGSLPVFDEKTPYSTSDPAYKAYQERTERSFENQDAAAAELEARYPSSVGGILTTPAYKFSRSEPQPGDSRFTAALKAVENQAKGFAEFAESPIGAATALVGGGGGALAKKAVAGVFGAQMASQVPESAREAGRIAGETGPGQNLQQKIEADIGMGANVVLPGVLGAEASGLRVPRVEMEKPLPEPPPIQPVALLPERGQSPRFAVEPQGTAVDVTGLSPNELTELQRTAESRSRQTEAGREAPVNTVAAALEKEPEPTAKEVIRSNGANWYRKGDYWVTDKPTGFMQKSTLKAGRGNPVEDAIVQDLEAKDQLKEAAKSKDKNLTGQQKIIEDVTGISQPQKQETATALALREAWERKVNSIWASPKDEYGPNGAISMRQQQKLDNFPAFLEKTPTDELERFHASISKVQPKYPYDIKIKQMLEDRLGIQRPPSPPGELGGATPELPAPPTPPQLGGPNAVREPSTGEVLQRQPGEAGGAGSERGRVEQGQQGNEAAPAQAGPEIPPKAKITDDDRMNQLETLMDNNLATPDQLDEYNKLLRTSNESGHAEMSAQLRRAKQVLDADPLAKIDYNGGLTVEAVKLGASLTDPKELTHLRAMEKVMVSRLKQVKTTLASDPDAMVKYAAIAQRLQYFREAIEGATGGGGSETKRAIFRQIIPDYKPPFPEVEKEVIPGEEKVQEKEGVLTPKPELEAAAEPAPVSPITPYPPLTERTPEESAVSRAKAKYRDYHSMWGGYDKRTRSAKAEWDAAQTALDKSKAASPAPVVGKSGEISSTQFPKFLTDLWDDQNPPPKGIGSAFSDEKLAKAGMNKADAIRELNRLAQNRDPELMLEAIKNSRTPGAALRKIMLDVPRESEAQQAQSRAVRSAPPPKPVPAQEAFNQGKKPAPSTPEQAEMGKWQTAWLQATNAERYSKAEVKAANEFLEQMRQKHGTLDPNNMPGFEHLKRQGEALKKARENPPPAPTPPEERPGIGSRVTKTIDGVKQTGTVYAQGGDVGRFMVRYGPKSREVIEPFDEGWVLDKGRGIPDALPEKSHTMADFMAEVRKASGIKNQDLLTAFGKTLDKVVPGFMERARAASERLQNAMRKEGSEPAPYRVSYSLEGDQDLLNRLIESVSKAAKEQEYLNRGYKKGSEGGAADALAVAKQTIEKAEQRGRSSTAMGITPQPPEWLRKFAEEDVAPAVKKGVDAVRAAKDLIVNIFSPETNAGARDVDELFKSKGYKEQFMTQAAAAVESARRDMGAMPREEQIAFIDRIKTGKKQPTPELQNLADTLRKWDDRLHSEASKYKPDLAYLDNHYRVLWKVIPGTADKTGTSLEQIMSKRPWRGSRGFTLQHTLEDMSEGIAKGGVPVSYNPVENFLLHAQDVMKFVAANRAWEALKKSGSAELVERGEEVPPGFVRLEDTIARQYFKTKDTKPGEWYVEEGAARMINNYLSKDYIRQGPGGALGRGLIDLKNLTTAVELGLSPFHAIFETNEAVGSSMGLAIAKMFSGRMAEGGREFAKALPGTIPLVGGFIPKTASLETFKLGSKLIEYAKRPEEFKARYPDAYAFLKKNYPGFEGMVDDLFSGGGQVSMHDEYHIQAAKGFREAVANDNYVGAVVRAIPAISQKMLQPLFEIYIPRLKVGTFAREYAFELARRADDLASGKITRPELARQTWAFVEDRFGELNWDNLYWNRTFKSAMQLLFRSVTWKLGNIRGFGKAARDTVQQLGFDWYGDTPMGAAVRGLKEGPAAAVEAFRNAPPGNIKPPRLTMPMAWVGGMALVTAIQSSIITKVTTGKYPWQLAESNDDMAKNLTFPRIDKDDPSQRVSIPTYWKDAIHGIHNPVDYVHSSMTGEAGRMWDVWNNRDFYGRQVYNPDDPFFQRIKDRLEHMIPVPFSLGSVYSAKQSGASNLKSAAGLLGYTKAPYYVSHTHAEQKADELIRDQLPQGSRTKEQYQKTVNERQVLGQVKRGELTMEDAENRGLIQPRRGFELSRHMNETKLQQQVDKLGAVDSMKVYDLGTPKEKAEIKDIITRKIFDSRVLDSDEKGRLFLRLENQQPSAKPAPAFDPSQPFQIQP